MAQCYDSWSNAYVYCTSHTGAYIAVGIVIPVSIFIIILLIAGYRRYRQRRLRRGQQQINMATVVPIYNNDEQQQAAYNLSYPPNYTALTDTVSDKPPSYEQTIQHLSEINNTSDNAAAVLPVTTVTSSSSQPAYYSSLYQN